MAIGALVGRSRAVTQVLAFRQKNNVVTFLNHGAVVHQPASTDPKYNISTSANTTLTRGWMLGMSTIDSRPSFNEVYLRPLYNLSLRYGVFDFEYTHQCQGTTEASKKEKLFLISWCPDSAKIKKKMLYSSSFDALKKCLVGVQKYIQVS